MGRLTGDQAKGGGGAGGEKSFGHRYRRLYVYVVFPHSHLQHFNALVSALGTRPNICRDSAHLSWSSLCKHILEHFWWAKRLYTEGWVYGYKCSNTWLLFFCFDHFSVFFCFFQLFIELFWRSMEQLWFHHCTRQFNWYHNGRTQCKWTTVCVSTFSSLFSFFFLFSFSFFLRAVQNYFSDPWNVFDFIIVLGSFVDILYSEITVS